MRETAERRPETPPGAVGQSGEPRGAPAVGPAGPTPLQRLIAPGDQERIARLFGAAAEPGAEPAEPGDLDGPAAIRLIRAAGEWRRQERAAARDAVREAHALVDRSARDAEAAEQRARAAEDAAGAAQGRAEAAEAAAAAAEARACRAEAEATLAREAEAEARLWLRRLMACLMTEFGEVAEMREARS
jgi:hypothetical protein